MTDGVNYKVKIVPTEAKVPRGGVVSFVAELYRGEMKLDIPKDLQLFTFVWSSIPKDIEKKLKPQKFRRKDDAATLETKQLEPGVYSITVTVHHDSDPIASDTCAITIVEKLGVVDVASLPPVDISTKRFDSDAQALNTAIRTCTDKVGFKEYVNFVDEALCDLKPVKGADKDRDKKAALADARDNAHKVFDFKGAHAYDVLKLATEIFLLLNNCNVGICVDTGGENQLEKEERHRWGKEVSVDDIKEKLDAYLRSGNNRLPYLDRILTNLSLSGLLADSPFCKDHIAIKSRVDNPCFIELIWSYWHEEGMLTQTLNAIALRFQNKKTSLKDPVAHLTIDPLRPLNNFLWGYIQDEPHRLSLQRRAYEYDHEYGLTLVGKAIPMLQTADSRSKFLEAFHSLLNSSMNFYKEENNKMMVPDAFPLLNALKEVHLLLAEGAHNQFGDLPWTARVEMLMQQWMLSRPEMREFLGRRPMMPYTEGWMAPVDAMKTIQGWTDVSVIHFRDLATFGEQILLSIRHGDWNNVNDSEEARNWALYWKSEIQSYVHSYRTVTGVDLANPVVKGKVDATKPAVLLSRRLASAGG